MREILFRGKRIDNGEWVEGFYNHIPNGRGGMDEHLIQAVKEDGSIGRLYNVEPETVGQFTGLTDKNGKKIFDGDILVFSKGATHPIMVYWDGLGWKFLRNGKRIEDAFECNTISHIQYCEVIGNIHDKPELIGGGE